MTKLNHTKAKWDIARFFCYALLTSCLFSRGVFMLYLTHKGLTVAQVGLYQMLVQLSMFLLEVPTGSVGDKVGKVHSLQIGTLLLLLHCVLMMALQQPAALVALGFLEGMGYTFSSGSDDALFYELLKKNHQEQDYLQLNARLKSAQSIWHLLFCQLFCRISGLSVRDLAVQMAVQTDYPFLYDRFAGRVVCLAGVHPAARFVCGVRLHLLPDTGSRLYPGGQHYPDVHCVRIPGYHPLSGVHAAVTDVCRELFCFGWHSGPDRHYRFYAFSGSRLHCRAGMFPAHPDLPPKITGQIRITV